MSAATTQRDRRLGCIGGHWQMKIEKVIYEGNNIGVVLNVSCHFEQSEKSRKRLMQSSCQRVSVSVLTHATSAAEVRKFHVCKVTQKYFYKQ